MEKQGTLFSLDPIAPDKSYRAIRHEVVRTKQATNCDTVHHPDQKERQVRRVLEEICGCGDLSILEMFAGHGNLTRIYSEYGEVISNEKSKKVFDQLKENVAECMLVHCNNVDSFIDFHNLISLKQTFDVIDLDPYGFPTRFFPDIFLLIHDGVLFITMPKPSVNILNGITQTHLVAYFGEQNPGMDVIVQQIATWGLCHWRQAELIDWMDLKSVWRFAFRVKKIKATEYTGVRNR